MKHPKFGMKPSGDRLALIKKSLNYKENKFINRKHTPELTEGNTMLGVTYDYIFHKGKRRRPIDLIPSLKTDLLNLPPDKDVLVWFGHSSYFIQIEGKKILVDPVFSGNASPVPGTVKSFNGTDRYTANDFPPIDYLFISHDHYDHVDYETLVALRPKIQKVVCGLGVGAHFEHWGYKTEHIIERDWYDTVNLGDGFTAYTTPARHFSGRGFTRNNTLWMSYVLQTPSMKIYIGGDSGYDTHFAEIGTQYGPIDLAILDNGQYDERWRYIHTLPAEVLQAARDLKAKRLFPVHSSKFVLANHPWDEPLKKVTELNKEFNIPLVTPMIGELVNLKDEKQTFQQWWTGIE
ncbi:MAG TPA: MBL fold metallo-hydrolase [Chitinophagaceae bacterium]|nr:MBL fold metallo-hydrolase [Chitinophagaceae bacterium]